MSALRAEMEHQRALLKNAEEGAAVLAKTQEDALHNHKYVVFLYFVLYYFRNFCKALIRTHIHSHIGIY